MKTTALMLEVTQNSANYKRSEEIKYISTLLLPQPSTIIGAMHYICGWTNYHPMSIAIQGKYDSINTTKKNYVCYANSFFSDRGTMVKHVNKECHSSYPIEVSKALTSQKSNHLEKRNVKIYREDLLDEYISLKQEKENIEKAKKNRLQEFVDEINAIKKRKSSFDKESQNYKDLVVREKELKNEKAQVELEFNKKTNNISSKMSCYKTKSTIPTFIEELQGVHLFLYIKANRDDLDTIYQNIDNLNHLGRAEDMLQIENVEFVELEEPNEETYTNPLFLSYIPVKNVRSEDVNIFYICANDQDAMFATRYYLNTKYEIIDGKRDFSKHQVDCILCNNYSISDKVKMDNVFVHNGKNGKSIPVVFIE